MLRVNKTININGHSMVNEVEAMIYTASLSANDPQLVNLNYYVQNTEIYKANREECQADQTAFEDMVYALQEELLGGAENEAE